MASVNYFLKIDGIGGESADDKHKGEIDILSFSWGATNSSSAGSGGSGAGTGKATFQDIHFTKLIDKATPILLSSCASGKHLDNAVLTCRKAGGGAVEF